MNTNKVTTVTQIIRWMIEGVSSGVETRRCWVV